MNRKERRAAASADRAGRKQAGPDALFSAALGHHRAGQLSEAERLYREVLAREPRHAPALHFLGVLSHQQGQSAAAVELIEQAIAADGSIPDFHYNLGVILEAMGRRDEAAARYRGAAELKPDHFGAWLNLGNVLIALGRLEEAEAACRTAATLAPQSGEARYNLGTVLARRERYAEAASEFAAAARLKPDFAAAHASLGAALLAAHEPAQAAPHLRRALALDPRHLHAAVNLGQAALAQGDEAGALEAALAALAIGESREATSLFARAARHAQPRSDDRRFRELIARALEEGWDNPVNLIVPAISLVRNESGGEGGARTFCRAGGDPAVARRTDRARDPRRPRAGPRALPASRGAAAVRRRPRARRRRPAARAVRGRARRTRSCRRTVSPCCARSRASASSTNTSPARATRNATGAAALGDRLAAAAAQGADVPPQWIAAVAAYHPLASLPGAERLVERPTPTWPAPIAALLAQQVTEPRTERELRATLPRLTAIEDGVSRAVKQQYEENPDPRWISRRPGRRAGVARRLSAGEISRLPAARPRRRSRS